MRDILISPLLHEGKKKAIFDFILNRIRSEETPRLEGEVILKAVIQAILTYLIAVYKFPSMIIQKIQATMPCFRWGSSD